MPSASSSSGRQVCERRVLCIGFGESEAMLASNLELRGLAVVQCRADSRSYDAELAEPGLSLVVMVTDERGNEGLNWLREYRERIGVPIVMLTSNIVPSTEILGFKLGADDMISRFSSPVLTAMKLMRLASEPVSSGGGQTWKLNSQKLFLDSVGRLARMDGVEIEFTEREWRLLEFLAGEPDKVRSRDEILETCLGYEYEGYDRLVDTYIKNLRRKLGNPEWIRTQRGYGYRFMGSIIR